MVIEEFWPTSPAASTTVMVLVPVQSAVTHFATFRSLLVLSQYEMIGKPSAPMVIEV